MKKNKEYFDSNGVIWNRYDSGKCLKPLYRIPFNVHSQIQSFMLDYLQDINEHAFYYVSLPYYSVPMWVKYEKDISTVLDYSYCVCCHCGHLLTTPGQLCVLFLLGLDNQNCLTMTWRIQLKCTCSIKEDMYNDLSYFPFLLHSQAALEQPIKQGWTQFIDELESKPGVCSICGIGFEKEKKEKEIDQCQRYCCQNVVCNVLYDKNCTKQMKTKTIQDYMNDMLLSFFTSNVDLISPLLSFVCYDPTCRARLKTVKNPSKKYECCHKCRQQIYCSKECYYRNEERHLQGKCKSYLDIFI